MTESGNSGFGVESPSHQAKSAESHEFLAESEHSDQSESSDFGFGGNFGSSDEAGVFGLFSGAVSTQVCLKANILKSILCCFLNVFALISI